MFPLEGDYVMTTLQQQLASITNAGEAISFIENEITNIGVKQVKASPN